MGLNWIQKGQRGNPDGQSNGLTSALPSPNTINGLYAADVVLSPSSLSLLVNKGGATLAQILVAEIIAWDIAFTTITLITLDPTNLILNFAGPTEASNALIVIENAANL